MPSFRIPVTPSRRHAARFIADVRRELVRKLADERAKTGVTQSAIARALDVHRSVISRELRGRKDITLGRVGELAWALGREPHFELRERSAAEGSNLPPGALMVRSTTGTSQTSAPAPAQGPPQAFVMTARAA
jgi:hypothetical protein